MEEIAISKFKAACSAVLERVRTTKKPVRITRFGKPVAEVVPPATPVPSRSRLGAMKGSVQIKGDIIDPAVDETDWAVLKQ